MNRRDILRYLSVTLVLGSILNPLLTEKSFAGQLRSGRNLFRELGIRTFINAAAYTHMSGTIMYEELVRTARRKLLPDDSMKSLFVHPFRIEISQVYK